MGACHDYRFTYIGSNVTFCLQFHGPIKQIQAEEMGIPITEPGALEEKMAIEASSH